jgi:hypothetical protein
MEPGEVMNRIVAMHTKLSFLADEVCPDCGGPVRVSKDWRYLSWRCEPCSRKASAEQRLFGGHGHIWRFGAWWLPVDCGYEDVVGADMRAIAIASEEIKRGGPRATVYEALRRRMGALVRAISRKKEAAA